MVSGVLISRYHIRCIHFDGWMPAGNDSGTRSVSTSNLTRAGLFRLCISSMPTGLASNSSIKTTDLSLGRTSAVVLKIRGIVCRLVISTGLNGGEVKYGSEWGVLKGVGSNINFFRRT